ncbi:MAG: hypothetical protein QOE92_1824 [Chloroflexota bacterium]|nr:hypothetical protein [Chloroflexota bacterium]
MRLFVGDELYAAELAGAVAAQAARRKRVEAFLDVTDVSLDAAAVDGDRERVTVGVQAQSAEHVIDLDREVVIAGNNTLRRWRCDLVFERAAGAVSNALRGTATGSCPHCQAFDGAADDGRCRACGEHVTGGEYDWVLTRETRL